VIFVPVYRTWLEISSEALSHNVRVLRSCLAKDVAFIGVVKANAYGHGLPEIVQMLDREDVKHFAVDSIEEAIRVRIILPRAEILTLGFVPDERLDDVVLHNLQPVLYDLDQIRLLNEAAGKQGKHVSVHVKIETGLARQGVFPDDLPRLVKEIQKAPHLDGIGLCTHFSCAEDLSRREDTQKQTRLFYETVGSVASMLPNLRYVHAACSAAILCHPESHGTAVRAGIALYGLWPSENVESDARSHHLSLNLHPVLSWHSRVAQVKDYPAGKPIGYEGTEILNRPTRVAVVPVGYYDGFDRRLSRQADVLIRGHRCKVLGTVCMNMMMVDASRVPAIERSDRVTLIGQDGAQNISAGELAKKIGTVHWEAVARISSRFPRLVV